MDSMNFAARHNDPFIACERRMWIRLGAYNAAEWPN